VKRFHWPLQRLLDVTAQREKSQKAELLAISRLIARRRQEVLVHRASVRRMITEMSALTCQERIRRHRDFVNCSRAHERQIEQLEARLAQLAGRRAEKTQLLVKTRKRRETLERLRAEAMAEHMRQQLRIEQKQFDESSHLSKARELIEARLDAE
jgi:flagellar export protein FliJ